MPGLAFAAREKLALLRRLGRQAAHLAAGRRYSHAAAHTVDAHQGWVRALAVHPDGKLLASCGNDRLVKLWSIPDGQLVRTFAGHDSHVYNVQFHPKTPHVVSADLKGILKVWDLNKGTEERTLDAKVLNKYDVTFGAEIGGVRGMAFSGDGGLLACAGITDVQQRLRRHRQAGDRALRLAVGQTEIPAPAARELPGHHVGHGVSIPPATSSASPAATAARCGTGSRTPPPTSSSCNCRTTPATSTCTPTANASPSPSPPVPCASTTCRARRELRIIGYQPGPSGYRRLALNDQRRLWLDPVQMWLGRSRDRNTFPTAFPFSAQERLLGQLIPTIPRNRACELGPRRL